MDRNLMPLYHLALQHKSPPARVAWIETTSSLLMQAGCRVATREGGVDRNYALGVSVGREAVATREGGVDRNSSVSLWS